MVNFNARFLWWTLFLTAVIALLVGGMILEDIPEPDMAHRYMPMSEAFAEGDWHFAFHPRIQPLQIICGGSIAFLTGASAFTALKIASVLWFIAGGALLYGMFRELYSDRKWIATAATVFYALHPYSFHLAVSGLRDSAKGALLIMTAWGLIRIWRRPEEKKGFFLLAAAASLGIICRVDMILTALVSFAIGTALEWRQKKFPLHALCTSSLLLLTMLGNSLLNGLVPGAMMPDTRLAELFAKVFHRAPEFTDALLFSILAIAGVMAAAWLLKVLMKYGNFAVAVIIVITTTAASSIYFALTLQNPDISGFIMAVIKGFYHFAGAFEIAVIIALAILKKLTPEEKILTILVLLNAALNIISMQFSQHLLFITSRYLAPALPLWAGFFVLGVKMIYDLVDKFTPRWLTNTLLALSCTAIAGGLLYHMFQPPLRSRTHRRQQEIRQTIREISASIAADYHGSKEYRVKQHIFNYQSKKYPKIFFADPGRISVSASLAGGSITYKKRNAHYIVSSAPPAKKGKIMHTSGNKTYYIWRTRK